MDKELFKQYGGATPEFSLNDTRTFARVVSVYDGDTITAVIPILGAFFKFKVRLHGIDTCEIKSKNQAAKDMAVKARNRVIELVTGLAVDATLKTKKDIEKMLDADVHLVWLHCLEMDKYGRVLAHVYPSSNRVKSISEVLLDEKLAYAYSGETKKTEQEQVEYLKYL